MRSDRPLGLTACGLSTAPRRGWSAPRLRREKLFTVIKISTAEVTRFLPPRDGAYLTHRFQAALGVAQV